MDLPADSQLRWILRHTATLLEQGAEPVSGLVQPNGEFFPDHFDASPRALAALMNRVKEHAGLGDLTIDLSIVTPEGEAQKVSCASGACGPGGKIDTKLGRVSQRGDGDYMVAVTPGEARNPVVLTTTFVRSVSHIFLTEADAYRGVIPTDREPVADLAAVLLGFGVLMSNGAYLYMKGCSGVSVHSATRMPVDEITVGLALFCKLHDVSDRAASKHLELTPAEHFDEASVWASSNSALVKLLRDEPERIREGEYSIAPARSWLARALGGKKKRARSDDEELADLERSLPAAAAKPRVFDPQKAEKLAELRALVDESFGS